MNIARQQLWNKTMLQTHWISNTRYLPTLVIGHHCRDVSEYLLILTVSCIDTYLFTIAVILPLPSFYHHPRLMASIPGHVVQAGTRTYGFYNMTW